MKTISIDEFVDFLKRTDQTGFDFNKLVTHPSPDQMRKLTDGVCTSIIGRAYFILSGYYSADHTHFSINWKLRVVDESASPFKIDVAKLPDHVKLSLKLVETRVQDFTVFDSCEEFALKRNLIELTDACKQRGPN